MGNTKKIKNVLLMFNFHLQKQQPISKNFNIFIFSCILLKGPKRKIILYYIIEFAKDIQYYTLFLTTYIFKLLLLIKNIIHVKFF